MTLSCIIPPSIAAALHRTQSSVRIIPIPVAPHRLSLIICRHIHHPCIDCFCSASHNPSHVSSFHRSLLPCIDLAIRQNPPLKGCDRAFKRERVELSAKVQVPSAGTECAYWPAMANGLAYRELCRVPGRMRRKVRSAQNLFFFFLKRPRAPRPALIIPQILRENPVASAL